MRAAVLENGIATNVIILQPGEDPRRFGAVYCGDEVGIGWSYTGEGFLPPPRAAAPAPAPSIPTSATNRDWRVALLLWTNPETGRPRFDEVEEKVREANESGSISGRIAYQSWDYANHVYLAELLSLREAFGFSEAEVVESMARAAAVAAQSAAA